MELELKRTTLPCWESVARITLEQEETGEMIVPDACPDIWQILDGEGRLLLQRKEAQEGKAELSGLLKVTILYQPEGANHLEAMEVTLPFALSPELSGVTRRCVLLVEPQVLAVDVHLLNPRKVLVRVGYLLTVEAFAAQALSLAGLAEDAETYGIRQKTAVFQSLLTTGVQEKNFTYSDTLTLPAGRPEVEKLLSVQAEGSCTEARVIGTKLVFKGEAVLKLLCRSQDGGAFTEEFHLPYSQMMDCGESGEEALCTVSLFFTDIKCTLSQEEPHTIQVELSLLAQGLLYRSVEVPVLADLYSTLYTLDVQTGTEKTRTLLGRSQEQETVREILPVNGTPTEILDVRVRLGRSDQHRENRDQVLRQTVEAVVLLNGENGPTALRETFTVTHRLPEQGAGSCTFTCQAARSPSAALTVGGVEVSFPLTFQWMTLEAGEVPLLGGVTLGEKQTEGPDRPAVILRVVRPGETLWDVAKSCLSTDEEILEATGLESSTLTAGQMLLIPR